MNKTVFLGPLWLSSESLNPNVVLGLPNGTRFRVTLISLAFEMWRPGGVFFHFRRLLISLLCFQMCFCFHSCLSSWRISMKVMLALSYLSSMHIYFSVVIYKSLFSIFYSCVVVVFPLHLPSSRLVRAVPIFPFCWIYRNITSMIILLSVIVWTLLLPLHIYFSIFSLNLYFRYTICSLISLPSYSIYP